MPELAEVEFYRRQWSCGLGKQVIRVRGHWGKRVFRGANVEQLARCLAGSTLLSSEARGKQMLFRFSNGLWLGVHLGMTGTLRAEAADFKANKHDHLVLFQRELALVFSDLRQFGRLRLHQGPSPPGWWQNLPPALTSAAFTVAVLTTFFEKHRRLPIKAALLRQDGFPGVGNWMADEILWRARLNPHTPSGAVRGKSLRTLWEKVRWVCRGAMKHISLDFSDPPSGWFYHERWDRGGRCPEDRTQRRREIIGGRTTAWCPCCQK